MAPYGGLALLALLHGAHAFVAPHTPLPASSIKPDAKQQVMIGKRASAVVPLRAVWSNPMATEDYFRTISGRGPSETKDQPSVIIGKGMLGTALKDMGGTDWDVLLGRGESLPEAITLPSGETFDTYPIYVCVPVWEIENVIEATPKERRGDLVFCQSDNIEDLLKRYGLCRADQTCLLPYFTISPIGRPIDQRRQYDVGKVTGEPMYVAETVVYGKWRGAVTERLRRRNLFCEPLEYTYWRKHMIERCIFDCVFNLVGCVHPGDQTFRDLAEKHWEEVYDMITELSSCIRNTQAVVLLSGTQERLLALAKTERFERLKPQLPTEQEYPFRNGYFKRITHAFTSQGFRSLAPAHDEYLQYAYDKGLITYPLDEPNKVY